MFPLSVPCIMPEDSRIKFNHHHHPFSRQFLNPSAFPDVVQQFHLNSSGTSANGVSLPLNSSPSSHHNGLSHGALPWPDGSPEIDDDLAADFDGSLSGLGMEVGSSTYNMSEALMALPSLKNERDLFHGSRSHRDYDHSPGHSNNDSDIRPVAIVHGKKNRLALGHDEESSVSTGIKRVCISNEREVSNSESRFSVSTAHSSTRDSMIECSHEDCVNSLRCNRHSNSAPELRPAHQNSSDSSPSPTSSSVLTAILSGNNSDESPDARRKRTHDVSFSYILQAATSVATKVNEETMTYLNQGQSYEIKLKKTSGQQHKKVRTVIRVGFYERRLQYMETVLIEQWRAARHSERILEVDVPLSYGISDIINDAIDINKCSFVWDTSKDSGIFIKVNCISTEFTPKKHGGEKGVPFRIIIETHCLSPSDKIGYDTILHASSSQVKVFKPKGADRKHKTDREKLMRKGSQESEKFRASSDRTTFTECSIDQIYSHSAPAAATVTHSRHSSTGSQNSPERRVSVQEMVDSPLDFTSARLVIEGSKSPTTPTGAAPAVSRVSVSPPSVTAINSSSTLSSPQSLPSTFLRADATAAEAAQWLNNCRFEKYVRTFAHFSGADILRLTRSDLIQICDLSDGIRLYNSLHCQSFRPRSTIYVSTSPNEDFSALYLETLTANELKSKLCNILATTLSNGCNGKATTSHEPATISRIRMAGPAGIFIAVTDEVVQNIPHETMFMLEFERDGLNFKASLRSYK